MSVYYLHAVFKTTSMGYKFIIKVSYKNSLVLRKIYYCDLGQNFPTCPVEGQVETRNGAGLNTLVKEVKLSILGDLYILLTQIYFFQSLICKRIKIG